MSQQLTHSDINNQKHSHEIVVISDNIRTPENVGMVFRICEAFGVKRVYLLGNSPNLDNKKVLRTARSTEKKLAITFSDNASELINDLKLNKFQLVGLEMTKKSVLLTKFKVPENSKIALFIGAERFGIGDNILENLDVCIHINLFGENSSINVVNALSIALYEINRG